MGKPNPSKLSFGFPNERVTNQGYSCRFPGFAVIDIEKEGTVVYWRFWFRSEKYGRRSGYGASHRYDCDNMLQALAFIYELLKKHRQYQYLPLEVTNELP